MFLYKTNKNSIIPVKIVKLTQEQTQLSHRTIDKIQPRYTITTKVKL